MIISINAAQREFVYDTGNGLMNVTFDSIKESAPWKSDGMVTISYRNELDQECFTSFSKRSFLDNIAHHLPEQRSKPEDYEQDVLTYKLYRLLEGESEESIDSEVANVYSQRLKLETRKDDYKKTVNKSIVEFMKKKKAVMDRNAVLNDISRLVVDTLECVRVVSHFEETGELLMIREDLLQRENMVDVWKMFSDVNSEHVKYSVLLQEAEDNLKFNKSLLDADRASLEVAKEEDKEKFEQGIERAGRMVVKYTDEVATLNDRLKALTENRRELEKSVVEVLKEIRVLAQNQFELLKEKIASMPDYPDLGEAPDDIEDMGFVVSEEMKKMIAAANSKDMPEVTLKNMTPELAKSAFESKLRKEKKPK